MTEWLSKGVGDYQRLDGSRGGRDQAEYVDRLIDTHLVGTPHHSAERLADSVEATGIGRALLMVEGAATASEVTENIQRLGAELVPIVS